MILFTSLFKPPKRVFIEYIDFSLQEPSEITKCLGLVLPGHLAVKISFTRVSKLPTESLQILRVLLILNKNMDNWNLTCNIM